VRGKIAVEEHFVTPELKDTIFGSIGWKQEEWTAMADALQDTGEVRLADMDAAGIEIAAVSLAAPCIQDVVEPADASAKAAAANDALAAVVASHPDRYVGLAALALQDPAAAADELERCVGELGFRGALVNGYSSIGDLGTAGYYDEERYLPFWERVAALGVPFYLHPRNPLPTQRRYYEGREALLGPTWAFTVETATHCLRLMASGLFDRFPELTIVIGHMGELLPFAVERTEQRLSHIPSVTLERGPAQILRENFFITTSGNFHTQSLLGAILQVGADRILFAADYPFERTAEAAGWFDAVPIAAGDREKIGRGNAARLFGIEVGQAAEVS
jgi:gamma-resorcylate decarboxylase